MTPLTLANTLSVVCTPDSPDYSCTPPSGTNLQQQCSSIDATQGLLALTGLVRISNVSHNARLEPSQPESY